MKYIITEFQYLNLMESVEGKSEITERCWKGYTQKGMKTMFGKRYPNCVKIKKKKKVNESDEDFGEVVVSKKIFDRVFDDLNAENDGKGYVRWLLPDIPEGLDDDAFDNYVAFSKNHYGRLWISDCGLYHKLEFVKTFLGINEEDFYRLLVNYLNDKFSDVVGDRPVRDVGTHYC